MADPTPRQIDWDSSEVEDASLTVRLTGSASKAWTRRFESVLAMLDQARDGWGEVRLTKKAIKVSVVQQGSESDLRHFLESIVLQANADTAPSEDQDEEDHKPDADERMARTFRGFAAEPESLDADA